MCPPFVCAFLSGSRRKTSLVQFRKVFNGSYHLACVRILVIIPGNNLYLIKILTHFGNHRLRRVKERTVLDSDNVAGNKLFLRVTEGLRRSRLHSRVDALFRDIFSLYNRYEDRCGARRNGNSLCRTDQLAVELRNYKADGFRGACRIRNDIDSSGSCSSEVAFSVRSVKYHLV